MGDFKPLLGLVTIGLLLSMLGLGLGAFACLGKALWGETVDKIQLRLAQSWWRDVRLGGLHALGIMVMAAISHGRPLIILPTLLWLSVVLACLWFALPAMILNLGEKLGPRGAAATSCAGALCLTWGGALPYLGWVLLVVILLGTYGAGLAVLLEGMRKPPPLSPTAPLKTLPGREDAELKAVDEPRDAPGRS